MMRFLAVAADYDGTLAHHGMVDAATLQALADLKESGRKLILVTGRELSDLLQAFPEATALCERIVAENGAVVHHPAAHDVRALAPPPPGAFIERLRQRGVRDLAVGRVIVATNEPYETVVLQAIRELGLEHQVIFNKGAVMVLPSGLNKATGLRAALRELGLSEHNVVGVGDAENDHAFLEMCECAVAVSNALPALREKADLVMSGKAGAGVSELIRRLLADDLASAEPHLERHHIPLGRRPDGRWLKLPPHQMSMLVAGSSGGGKSTLLLSLLEGLLERRYQALVIDPEGDHAEIEGAVVLGNGTHAPSEDEVLSALGRVRESVVVNLMSVPIEDRPGYMQRVLPRLAELRAEVGRPHRIVLDEVHHVFPAGWESSVAYRPFHLPGFVAAAVHPDQIATEVLHHVDVVVATGKAPGEVLQNFCAATGSAPPAVAVDPATKGGALVWWQREDRAWPMQISPPRQVRRRHVRKYAQGELDESSSFYFEGRDRKLHLRAQNLQLFLQLADGVDDDTWQYHLERGDYSRWVRRSIKDDELAEAIAAIEHRQPAASPADSRAAVRREIESRYTVAA